MSSADRARVGLVFGGRSTEHRVSVRSARTVMAALEESGHVCVPFGVTESGAWTPTEIGAAVLQGDALEVLAAESGASIRPSLAVLLESQVDIIFPLVHGTFGEDGTMQGLCEMLDLPYVGCGVVASALAMDKALCKRVLAHDGIPVTPWVELRRSDGPGFDLSAVREKLTLPLFVKPSVGGSSVGVRKVESFEEVANAIEFALQFDEVVLVEQGIEGRELECSVLGNRVLEASAIGEIVPGNDFYDYADKYLDDRAGLLVPAPLESVLADELRRLAVAAVAAIGGSGMARVDFLLSHDGQIFLNEINTLPGFTAISMYPKLWGESGVELSALVDRLVEAGLERGRSRRAMDRSIRDWLAQLAG